MQDHTTDVTFHIDETLNHKSLEDIRDVLLAQDGVESASFHDKNPHLMIVLYDTDRVSCQQLLGKVETKGVHAEITG